jgi:S-formylglutathione hydrolase FrmB
VEPTRSERSGRAVGGFSMGGYGALRIGLGFAEDFCSVHSHSGAVSLGTTGITLRQEILKARGPEFTAQMERVFGPNPSGAKHDLLVSQRVRETADCCLGVVAKPGSDVAQLLTRPGLQLPCQSIIIENVLPKIA